MQPDSLRWMSYALGKADRLPQTVKAESASTKYFGSLRFRLLKILDITASILLVVIGVDVSI